jgi:hypothetical protein
VSLADPPLGPETEAFFGRVDVLLQGVTTPADFPMAISGLSLADLNSDGVLDLADFQVLRQAFGSCTGKANFNPVADLDGDNCITFKDFRIFLQLIQQPQ